MTRRGWKRLAVGLMLGGTTAFLSLALSSGENRIEDEIESRYGIEDPQFARTMGSLLGRSLTPGNKVLPLINGEQIFPAMLNAIAGAKRSINFETYIYWSGDIGKRFSDALGERARAGVKTSVLVDWVGAAKMDRSLIESMRSSGVSVSYYRPLRWYTLVRMNNRTHRKLLIIDGRVGFTGGVGIADLWDGHAQDPQHWRDTHFQIEGPVVAQLQAAFMDNWIRTRGHVLHGDDYFPSLEVQPANQFAQVFRSSAREGSDSMRLMYLLAIAAARKSIHMENAYFVPDDLSVRMLVAARKRGVDVQIIVPGDHTDQTVVSHASRAHWGPLLAAGVKIFRYRPTMLHCKIFIVDHAWTSVGSTNFDNRSFRLNDEANLNVFDAGFAAENEAQFERDKANADDYSLADWRQRGTGEKISEWLANWFRPQL